MFALHAAPPPISCNKLVKGVVKLLRSHLLYGLSQAAAGELQLKDKMFFLLINSSEHVTDLYITMCAKDDYYTFITVSVSSIFGQYNSFKGMEMSCFHTILYCLIHT